MSPAKPNHFVVPLSLIFIALTIAAAPGSTPQWIWGDARANTQAEAGRCEFRKTFQVGPVESATMQITCDDRYTLRLNGRLVGLGTDWQQWDAYDIGPLLKEGDNTLFVRSRNDGDAAGLLVKIQVQQPDGTKQTIVSDKSWQARRQTSGTWDPSRSQYTAWAAATALGPYPSTPPWKDRVAAAEHVQSVRAVSPLVDGPFRLRDGDRVIFLGGTLVERAQQYGYMESVLTAAFPESRLVFRNLGWSGDTVFGQSRARFGTVSDGFEHLETHVFAEEPTVIFVAYGTNESFGGTEKLGEFTAGLNNLLDVLATTGAHCVLMTPFRFENLGPPLPDPTAQNKNIKAYRDRILEVAETRDCGVVDLYDRLPRIVDEYGDSRPITHNGMHLNQRGYWYASQAVLAELELPRPRVHVTLDLNETPAGEHQVVGAEIKNVVASDQQIQLTLRSDQVLIPHPDAASASAGTDFSQWTLAVQGLQPGDYTLRVDGTPVASGSSEQWTIGLPMSEFPPRRRAEALREKICDKNELYFHRWRPQNETYLFLFRKHEQGNNASEIPEFDPFIEEAEEIIRSLAQPTSHVFEWVRQP